MEYNTLYYYLLHYAGCKGGYDLSPLNMGGGEETIFSIQKFYFLLFNHPSPKCEVIKILI